MGYRDEPTNVAELAGGAAVLAMPLPAPCERRLGLDSRKPKNLNRTCFLRWSAQLSHLGRSIASHALRSPKLEAKAPLGLDSWTLAFIGTPELQFSRTPMHPNRIPEPDIAITT